MSPAAEPFTFAAYEACIDAAIGAGYEFRGFAEAQDGEADANFILLRHDIDYDPACVAPISRIEAERAAVATYFFQPSSPYYGLDAPPTLAAIEAVLRDGHRLGLHFDATTIADDEAVLLAVEQTATAWEARFDTPIDAVSFHMPTHRPVGHLRLLGERVNTYAPAFHERIAYASDSNQDWRGKDIIRILTVERPRVLQLLTHPMWWRERFVPFLQLLEELAARIGIDVERDILTPEQRAILARPDFAG